MGEKLDSGMSWQKFRLLENLTLHWEIPTQRSSEDFEVGEIISFTKMGEIGMLNMESCSARCLSRNVGN